MKLSDIKGERTLDVVAELIDPIYNLVIDEDVMEVLQPHNLPKGMNETEYGAKMLKEMCIKILKVHKADCIKIFAVIDDKSEEEYLATLDLTKLLQDVMDLLSDDVFKTLFFSTAQSAGTPSGSALANTEDTSTSSPSPDMPSPSTTSVPENKPTETT